MRTTDFGKNKNWSTLPIQDWRIKARSKQEFFEVLSHLVHLLEDRELVLGDSSSVGRPAVK